MTARRSPIPCPRLIVGQIVEIENGGTRYLVKRVGAGSATVREINSIPRQVVIENADGTKREFTSSVGREFQWSVCAMVRVVGDASGVATPL